MRRSFPARAWLVLAGTLLLWSGNWIVARAVRDDISPGIATAGRLVIVIALLAPFCWRGLGAQLKRFTRRDWQVLAGLGFTGGGLHLALQWLGLHYTTATSGILYLSTSPIFILLLARPPDRRWFFCTRGWARSASGGISRSRSRARAAAARWSTTAMAMATPRC